MPSATEISERVTFIEAAVKAFADRLNALDPTCQVQVRAEAIPHAVKLYFLMSDAYKRKRVHKPDAHRSEPYKIAAITAAVLSGVCLLEPVNSEEVTSDLVALSNELFAVSAVCAILDVTEWEIDDTNLRRHYLALANLELDACREYIEMLSTSPEAALEISSIELSGNDLFALDMLVNAYIEWWRTR